MAHEIDETTGQAACFTAGAAPWHRLGQNVQQAQTAAEAIKLAVLDWTVEKWPLEAVNPAGGASLLADHYATVRSDTRAPLGVVGGQYTPFQNAEAFAFVDSLVQDREVLFETAGALHGGRRVWMLARLPRQIEAAPGDVIHPYVLVYNSHDGSSSLRMLPTTVRVVCQNTLNLALGRARASEGLTISHHTSLHDRVEEARRKLHLVNDRLDEFAGQAHRLARVTLSREQLAHYFGALVDGRSEKSQKKVLEAFAEGLEDPANRVGGSQGTAWAAYNAVSRYTDHLMTVRGGNETARLNSRLNSIWFGSANDLKQRAWEMALQLAV